MSSAGAIDRKSNGTTGDFSEKSRNTFHNQSIRRLSMFRKHTKAMIGGILAIGLTLSGSAFAKFTVEEAAELDSEAKATLGKFVTETKGAEEVFADAKGILVCPKIRKAGAQEFFVFFFGEKGLIADVTWEGSRFKKLDVE